MAEQRPPGYGYRHTSKQTLNVEVPPYRDLVELARSLGVPKQELDELIDTDPLFQAWQIKEERAGRGRNDL